MAKRKAPIERVVSPFRKFLAQESAGGIVLMAAAAIAMIWANSSYSESYDHFWHAKVGLSFGEFKFSMSLAHWINDGLMALFFFVVGLEIKREVLAGELSTMKKAALPAAAAIGGMVVPALVYTALNFDGIGAHGWGIPMATDIAFAIGVLTLLGKRVPLAIKVFLTALAIVDDIGAVLVIAVFYTSNINVDALMIGFLLLIVLMLANMSGVRKPVPYILLGLPVWICFLSSGVHATVAGVLVAMTIPARTVLNVDEFVQMARNHMNRLEETFKKSGDNVLTNLDQQECMEELEHQLEEAETPLQRMEHTLHPFSAFFIMPVFALANAGVHLSGDPVEAYTQPVTLGIILGLFFGKQIGVTLFSWIAVKAGWASLPKGVGWLEIYGVSMLSGIGFTMSLFVANLAFPQYPELLPMAKIGILSASVVSAIIGWLILSRIYKTR